MRFSVEYNPDFFNDLIQAVDWYNEQQAGVGDRFYKNVKMKTAKLSTTALQFAEKYDVIRCARIDKFPYLVHYRVDVPTKTVKVEALFHTSRDPKIWYDRTENQLGGNIDEM
jgi:hypothetical protein